MSGVLSPLSGPAQPVVPKWASASFPGCRQLSQDGPSVPTACGWVSEDQASRGRQGARGLSVALCHLVLTVRLLLTPGPQHGRRPRHLGGCGSQAQQRRQLRASLSFARGPCWGRTFVTSVLFPRPSTTLSLLPGPLCPGTHTPGAPSLLSPSRL